MNIPSFKQFLNEGIQSDKIEEVGGKLIGLFQKKFPGCYKMNDELFSTSEGQFIGTIILTDDGRGFRINYVNDSSGSARIHSVDIWNQWTMNKEGYSNKADFHCVMPDMVSFAKVLPALFKVLESPKMGEIILEGIEDLKKPLNEAVEMVKYKNKMMKRPDAIKAAINDGVDPDDIPELLGVDKSRVQYAMSTMNIVPPPKETFKPSKADSQNNKLLDMMKQWQPKPEDLFEDIYDYSKLVLERKLRGLLVLGKKGGTGKSYNVEKALKDSGQDATGTGNFDGTTVYKGGAVSDAGLYNALWRYRNGIVILDDADGFFDDVTCSNMLKGALDSSDRREVSRVKAGSGYFDPAGMTEDEIVAVVEAGKGMPNKFVFTGGLIAIANRGPDKISQAVLTRCQYIDVDLTNQDMMLLIKKRLSDIKIEGNPPMEIREKVFNVFLEHQNNPALDINYRVFGNCCVVYNMSSNPETAMRRVMQTLIQLSFNDGGKKRK